MPHPPDGVPILGFFMIPHQALSSLTPPLLHIYPSGLLQGKYLHRYYGTCHLGFLPWPLPECMGDHIFQKHTLSLQSSPEDVTDPRLTQHPPALLFPYVSQLSPSSGKFSLSCMPSVIIDIINTWALRLSGSHVVGAMLVG
jgi:hypothetical protein